MVNTPLPPLDEQLQRAQEVQEKYADELLNKPHVVGLAVGFATINGMRSTREIALVVMVDALIPNDDLPPEDQIPDWLEGVRVDVQQTGLFSAGFSAE